MNLKEKNHFAKLVKEPNLPLHHEKFEN